MIKFHRKLASCVLAAAILFSAACSTIADPDAVGLYYLKGNSDGYKFSKCIEPGATGDAEWNNEAIYLPTNLRTWTIDDMPDPNNPGKYIIAPGADSADVIVVSAAPEEGQPSGVQVRVSTKTNFKFNTYCDASGGKVKELWETIGRRYKADTEQGRRDLYNAELVPVQKTIIKDVLRAYSANPLIANQDGIQTQAQQKIAERLTVEFNRIAGGNFFCGPSFNRARPDCPPLELLIIGIENADPGIQAARNEKQKAVELAAAKLATANGEAAALVAEAKGKKDAAAELTSLYNSPAWVALQQSIIQLEMQKIQAEAVKACGNNPNCHMFVGNTPGMIFSTK